MQYHPSARLKKKLFWTQTSFIGLVILALSVLQAGTGLAFPTLIMLPSILGGLFLWGLAHAFHPTKRVVWLLTLGLIGGTALGSMLLTRLGCSFFAPLPACSANYVLAADFNYWFSPLVGLIVDVGLSGCGWVALQLRAKGR